MGTYASASWATVLHKTVTASLMPNAPRLLPTRSSRRNEGHCDCVFMCLLVRARLGVRQGGHPRCAWMRCACRSSPCCRRAPRRSVALKAETKAMRCDVMRAHSAHTHTYAGAFTRTRARIQKLARTHMRTHTQTRTHARANALRFCFGSLACDGFAFAPIRPVSATCHVYGCRNRLRTTHGEATTHSRTCIPDCVPVLLAYVQLFLNSVSLLLDCARLIAHP
jgi:hypothetical protein